MQYVRFMRSNENSWSSPFSTNPILFRFTPANQRLDIGFTFINEILAAVAFLSNQNLGRFYAGQSQAGVV